MFSPAIMAVLSQTTEPAEPPADDYADLTFWWTCEADTLGADDYSPQDTTPSADGFSIDAVVYKIGTHSLKANGAWAYTNFASVTGTTLSTTEGRIGFWVDVTTWQASYFPVISFYNSGGAWLEIKMGTNPWSDKVVQANWNDGSNSFSAYSSWGDAEEYIGASAWYFVQVSWDTTAGEVKIFIDTAASSSETLITTKSNTMAAPATPSKLTIGNESALAVVYYLDNIIISNDSARSLFALRNETASLI